MNNWWKAPVLQGPENDYGDYDYLIEELPDDYVKWEYSRYTCKCDSCGKERHLLLKSAHHFYTLDGYDYMDYNECWLCSMSGKLHSTMRKLKRFFNVFKTTFSYWRIIRSSGRKESFVGLYKFINAMHK